MLQFEVNFIHKGSPILLTLHDTQRLDLTTPIDWSFSLLVVQHLYWTLLLVLIRLQ